jgi:hypothetical protein
VAAGCRVATQNPNSGDTHPQWKEISYVERSDGQWISVSGAGCDYGYVNTGLDTGGSGSDYISMYGSW